MNVKAHNGEHTSQSAGLDRFEAAFLSAEISRTYTRRNADFGPDASSTAAPVEELGAEDRELWGQERWVGKPAEHPRFHLESSSPSGSEQLSRRQPSVAELILHVRKQFKAELAERLAKRLDYLGRISEEEYPEQAPIAPESLQDFVAFLESTPKLVYPGVVLTPSGNIQAEWRKGKNRHFAIEFVGSGDVHFVVFAPDPKEPYKTIRASGMATVASLTDIVRPYGVESWATASTRRAA